LPELPSKVYDAKRPESHHQLPDDFVMHPLRIQKVKRSSIELAEKSTIDKAGFQPLENHPFAAEKPYFDSVSPLNNDETKLITSMTDEGNENVDILPFDFGVADITRYHHPEHLSAPAIQVQPPTLTTPLAPLTTTCPNTSTIRVVDPFLQVPERVHYAS
jgi:hypothetical protein